MISNNVSFTGTPVLIGELVKRQRTKIAYNYTMSRLLEHSDKDYFNLTRKVQNAEKAARPIQTFAQGLRNFFEKGTMF